MKRRGKIGVVVGAIIIVLVVFLGYELNSVVSSNHDQTRTNTAVDQSSRRSDCKTEYNSILGAPVTKRGEISANLISANAALDSMLGSDLLSSVAGQKITPQQVAQFQAAKQTLDVYRFQLAAQIAIVDKLPTVAQAAESGFTFDGRHYPPCPVVATSPPPHRASK